MSNNLKKLRLEKRFTLRELGDLTKISYTTLGAMERGDRPFTQANLEILCKFFDVTSDYLLGFSEVRKPELQKVILDEFEIYLINEIRTLDYSAKNDILSIIKYLKIKGDLKN